MRAFAQSIVENVRHPLVILDDKMRVRMANAAFYRAFQVNPAEAEGHPFFELWPGVWSVPGLRALLEGVLPTGGGFEDFEAEHVAPDVGHRTLLLSARRVAHDETDEAMVLLAIEDVTERRRAAEALRRLNDELEQRVRQRTTQLAASNRELEAFCYAVSHDLRAPLRAIEGFSDELLRSYADALDARGRHYLERVRAGSQRMAGLIDDLLRLSRLTRDALRRERVDLSALARSVAADLAQREPARRVTFAVEPDLVAHGDPRLLRVAIENLFGNAWKFTAKKPEATVTFGRAASGGRAAFVVRDDGVGFDMAHAGNLFGAFQRLHHERDFPGNGIGLATVQRVILRHGGEVRAEGAPGAGAAFFFTLPDADEEP